MSWVHLPIRLARLQQEAKSVVGLPDYNRPAASTERFHTPPRRISPAGAARAFWRKESPPMNPDQSAIVRANASVRIAIQEATSLWKNLVRQERSRLEAYREIGLRLLPIRAARKGSDWLEILKQIGIPQQRASEALLIAENWKWITGSGSLTDALKSIKENVFTTTENDPESPKVQGGPENEDEEPGSETEPETPAEGVETVPPPDIGDAAEEVPGGVLWGADGKPLPPTAKTALEDTALDQWLADARKLYEGLKKLPSTESGVFVTPDALKKRLSGIAKSVRAQKPELTQMYCCPKCGGKGCDACRKKGWLPFSHWSDLK